MIKAGIPKNISNKVLLFILPRALDHIMESLILRTFESWKILDAELSELGEENLNEQDTDFKDLEIMRNKLIAHRVETTLNNSNDYSKWYKRKFGSYEKTFELIKRLSDKISSFINELIEQKKIVCSPIESFRSPIILTEYHISELVTRIESASQMTPEVDM